MTDEAALEVRAAELRRLVYGTPGGHESDAVAELLEVERALADIRAADIRAADAVDAPAGSALATLAPGIPPTRPESEEAPSEGVPDPAAPRHRTRRLVIAGAAIIAVVGATFAFGQVRDFVDPPRGLEIFDSQGDETDAGPRGFSAAVGESAVTTVRHIGRAVGYDVWVFRDRGDVCMMAQREHGSGWGANCVTEADFRGRGIRQIITYDEFSGSARPAGLDPASAVELAWNDGYVEVEWSIVPLSEGEPDGDRIWVPTSAEGATPMTYEEWSSARLARSGGS